MQNKKAILPAILAMLITIGVMWFANRAAAPRNATWEDVLTEARSGGYKLITTPEMAALCGRERHDFLLVDTRQEWEYRTGHIAGAINFPMEPTWWSRLSKASALESFLGPDRSRKLVFY